MYNSMYNKIMTNIYIQLKLLSLYTKIN